MTMLISAAGGLMPPGLATVADTALTNTVLADTALTNTVLADRIDTLWLILATVLALLMAPGVAFFYGGLVRPHGVVNMMMMSFGTMAVIGVIWVFYGYSMVFGPPAIAHWVGNPLADLGMGSMAAGMSMHTLALAAFHAAFAIDVVALISGAIADRARFGAWLLFAGLWATIVYFPVARWIFNAADGWAARLGVHDFAGGIAVHATAGAAALSVVSVLGKRRGFGRAIDQPHNIPLMLLGTAMLWIGWFGFNAGSEGGVDATTALAVINTIVTPAGAALAWLLVDRIRLGRVTSVGTSSGLIVGLVAAAPACDVLSPAWSVVLGVIAGVICALVADLRFTVGFDDSLNVVGIHLFGGVIGALFIGIAGRGIGVLDSGSWRQLVVQIAVTGAVVSYSAVCSYLIAAAIDSIVGFRAQEEVERAGVDSLLHGEKGYAWIAADARPESHRNSSPDSWPGAAETGLSPG